MKKNIKLNLKPVSLKTFLLYIIEVIKFKQIRLIKSTFIFRDSAKKSRSVRTPKNLSRAFKYKILNNMSGRKFIVILLDILLVFFIFSYNLTFKKFLNLIYKSFIFGLLISILGTLVFIVCYKLECDLHTYYSTSVSLSIIIYVLSVIYRQSKNMYDFFLKSYY